jgi:hypothetical protein
MNNNMIAKSFCTSNFHISEEGNQAENGTFFGRLKRNAEIIMHKAHEVPPEIAAVFFNVAFGDTFGNVFFLKDTQEVPLPPPMPPHVHIDFVALLVVAEV